MNFFAIQNVPLPGIIITCASGHHGQVGDHLLGVLGLAGTRLASDQHGVVLLVLQHVAVGALGNSPQVRRHLKVGRSKLPLMLIVFFLHLVPPLSEVDLANPVGVDGVPLVRVDNNLRSFSFSFPTLIVNVL